jgi:hypothetical protein
LCIRTFWASSTTGHTAANLLSYFFLIWLEATCELFQNQAKAFKQESEMEGINLVPSLDDAGEHLSVGEDMSLISSDDCLQLDAFLSSLFDNTAQEDRANKVVLPEPGELTKVEVDSFVRPALTLEDSNPTADETLTSSLETAQ